MGRRRMWMQTIKGDEKMWMVPAKPRGNNSPAMSGGKQDVWFSRPGVQESSWPVWQVTWRSEFEGKEKELVIVRFWLPGLFFPWQKGASLHSLNSAFIKLLRNPWQWRKRRRQSLNLSSPQTVFGQWGSQRLGVLPSFPIPLIHGKDGGGNPTKSLLTSFVIYVTSS